MIPPKVKLSGDKDRAEMMRAFGLSQLRILQRSMSFRDLKQDARRVCLGDGVIIEVKSVFGLDEVSIFVPPVDVAEVEEVKLKEVTLGVLGGRVGVRAGPAELSVCKFTEEELAEFELIWGGSVPEEMSTEGEVKVSVLGGVAPYQWSVHGGGYWFDEEHTITAITTELGWTWLYSDGTICGPAIVDVLDLCEQEVTGEVPFLQEGLPSFTWSEANPEEIARNTVVNLHAEGGVGPYEWKVTGQGYWFDPAYVFTEALSEDPGVKLYADGTICGDASIEVRDRCNQSASGTLTFDGAMKWLGANPTTFNGARRLLLCVVGGVPPYHWTITGGAGQDVGGVKMGYWLDQGLTITEIEAGSKCQMIYSDGEQCWDCALSVVDDCDTELRTTVAAVREFTLKKIGYLGCMGNVDIVVEGGVLDMEWTIQSPEISFSATDPDLVHLGWVGSRSQTIYVHDCKVCSESARVMIMDRCEDVIDAEVPIALGPELKYDPDNPETIDREDEESIAVNGGCPPFEWSVAGTGFSFENATTEVSTNILKADDAACGAANITITDAVGATVGGVVRSTAGQWVARSTGVCEMPGQGTTDDGGSNWELIIGNRKQLQGLIKIGTCNDTCAACGGSDLCTCIGCCNDGGEGCSGLACTPCIDYWGAWGGYLIPYIEYEGPKCNWYKNTSLAYYEWEC